MEFLQQLVESHGASGYEEAVQARVRERLQGHCDHLETDVMGSVIAAVNPEGRPRLLLDGHADEIGFVVRFIDDKGFLYVSPAGGWDAEIVVAQRVLVHTAKGPVRGVFGKRALHTMDLEERKKKSELESMWVDLGAKDLDQAKEWVEIGDFVTIEAHYQALPNQLAVAKSFDNRAGIFVVCETLRALHGQSLQAAVYGVSAVQEEIGCRGASTACFGVRPDIGIAIDVTHAVDYPEGNKKKASNTRLGGGPTICRGANINPHVFRRLIEVAKAEEIPYQVIANAGGTPTDANPIQLSRRGVAAALIGIPLRYMHSPCEMLNTDDLTNAVRLLAAFARSLSADDRWIPGL